MYNRMVLSEEPDAVEALRKRCEKWQGSSDTECTTMQQLPSSVLVQRVNAMLNTMKKEMDVMDSRFSNELKNLKRAHDRAALTNIDIDSVAALPSDNSSAAKLQLTNSKVEGKVIKSAKSDLPNLDRQLRKPPSNQPLETRTQLDQPLEKRSLLKPASQDKNTIRPASREKTTTKPASQDKTAIRPASREKTTTKPASQDKSISKPASQTKIITKPASQDKNIISSASQEKIATKPVSQEETAIGLVAHDKSKSQLKPHPVPQNSPRPLKISNSPHPINKSSTPRPVSKSNTPRPVNKSESPRPVDTSKKTAKKTSK